MKKPKLAKTSLDKSIEELAGRADHKTLAIWAADCAERVLAYFETKSPEDKRPRQAIEVLRTWIQTGIFKMAVIRNASLDAHAAAREVEEDDAARSAARAAGQAVATAHVPRHALGAGVYAATVIRDNADPSDAEAATLQERGWQYQHLWDLIEKSRE